MLAKGRAGDGWGVADELARRLLGLFAANGGVATVEQLGAAGLPEARLRRLVRRGVLRTVRRGVYTWRDVADKASSDPGQAVALEVAAVNVQTSASLVASHQSAAVMHGLSMLDSVPEGSVSVTQAGRAMGNSTTRSGVHIFTADMPDEHVMTMYGVPCTTVARTVIDLARRERFLAGVVVADDALHQMKTNRGEFQTVLDQCAGWPQVTRARRVVEFSDHRAESVLESIGRVVMHEHRLDPPELQVELGGADGFIGRVDYYWPQHRTVAEADGKKKYDTRDEAVRQLRRDSRLREAGFEVVHFTWADILYRPERVIASILAAFAKTERLR
jgi:predicted transcriptional regulator of viral defense system